MKRTVRLIAAAAFLLGGAATGLADEACEFV